MVDGCGDDVSGGGGWSWGVVEEAWGEGDGDGCSKCGDKRCGCDGWSSGAGVNGSRLGV